MIYLRSSIGVEIRGPDLLFSCLQSNLSAGVFTQFKRVSSYRDRDRAEVRREIDQFFGSARVSRDNVILGLPRRDVILRYVDLPAEVTDNLRQVVAYQVQSFEPTEEERYCYDFAALKPAPGAKRIQVLLVMIKRSILEAHLQLLRDLGIKPASVTVGSVGLANLFLQGRRAPNGRLYVLADLSPQGVEVLTLRGGLLLHSHESAKGDSTSWKDALVREVEVAAERIRLGPEEAIDRIVLAGESSEEARQDVSEAIPDCDLIGRYVRFEMSPQCRSHLQEAGSSLGLAYGGLAQRPPVRLNLLPAEMRHRQTRWAYLPSVILGIVILGLLISIGVRGSIQERRLIHRLDAEIASLKERVDRVQKLRAEARQLESEAKAMEELFQRRDMNLEVLQELTTVLPSDTFLSVYSNKEGAIQIAGSSAAAPDLIPKLEKSPLFKEVVQRGQIFKDAQTGKDRFIFEMKLER